MQDTSNYTENDEMIVEWMNEYLSLKDDAKRNKIRTLIVSRMLPMVKRIARKIGRRSYDPIDDMVQAGSIGLLKAIDTYSPEINDNFKIYAGTMIIGAMRHYLRDKLNTIKVPRHIQELAYRINSFINTLTPEELSELTNDYVAEALNIPTEEVDFARQADRRKMTISLENIFPVTNDSLGFEEVLPADDYREKAELADTKLLLKNLIDKLPEDCKEIVELYYYNDFNQKDIAEHLNLNQMQVSRRLKKAFGILYDKIQEEDIDFSSIREQHGN